MITLLQINIWTLNAKRRVTFQDGETSTVSRLPNISYRVSRSCPCSVN